MRVCGGQPRKNPGAPFWHSMIPLQPCYDREVEILNVFVKPKEQSDACIGYALAKKRA